MLLRNQRICSTTLAYIPGKALAETKVETMGSCLGSYLLVSKVPERVVLVTKVLGIDPRNKCIIR